MQPAQAGKVSQNLLNLLPASLLETPKQVQEVFMTIWLHNPPESFMSSFMAHYRAPYNNHPFL